MTISKKILTLIDGKTDTYETSLEFWVDDGKVKTILFSGVEVDVTRLFPDKFIDKLSTNSDDPTVIDPGEK